MLTELLVKKDAIADVTMRERPLPDLADGEVLVEVESYGLTANNVTYAVTGDMIGYWRFYPVEGAEGRGIVPVWGYGKVVSSKTDQLAEGERIYGFFPMATHVVLQPRRKTGAVKCMAPHRADLPAVYNNYQIVAEEPEILQGKEDARQVLFPLFGTSYVIYDWLIDNDFFGAQQIVVGSASSKTGFGVGAVLNQHDGDRPKTIGLTSPRNLDFVGRLKAFDDQTTYDHITSLPQVPTAFVDMSGNADVITALHNHIGDNVVVSSVVGATHWEAPRQSEPLPGAKPTMFFAPAQIAKREKDFGPGVVMGRAAVAWAKAAKTLDGLFEYDHLQGPDAASTAWRDSVEGKVNPSRGLVVQFAAASS
ncbi:MAG: DUF2855 family protein [Pseudomonadota bacterium]